MGLLSKDDEKRLTESFDYLGTMRVPMNKQNLLWDAVYSNGVFSSQALSKAISLDVGFSDRMATNKGQRTAARTAMLARLAAERPASLAVAAGWKQGYLNKKEPELQTAINGFLNQLMPATPLPVVHVTPKPAAYGITDAAALRNALKPVTAAPNVKVADPIPPDVPSVAANKQFFETVSRVNVVLSGHGSLIKDSAGTWPKVQLGPHQILRCYIKHYYPLGNDVGQLVDSRRFPVPVNEYAGGTKVPDYILQERETLTLLNHTVGDTHFKTVTTNTRLSTFLSDPQYSAATFHWAACRVVFNNAGKVACPTHNAWEDFDAACVLH